MQAFDSTLGYAVLVAGAMPKPRKPTAPTTAAIDAFCAHVDNVFAAATNSIGCGTGLNEHSYEPVKHELGWADFQVRAERAIVRHWQLVMLA